MWDRDYDNQGGVSIFGHMIDGAATGGLAGLSLAGIGAIPGAVLGGSIGLVNGLVQHHQQFTAQDEWQQQYQSGELDTADVQARQDANYEAMKASGEIQPWNPDVEKEQGKQTALNRVFYEDYGKTLGEPSWFDNLF